MWVGRCGCAAGLFEQGSIQYEWGNNTGFEVYNLERFEVL